MLNERMSHLVCSKKRKEMIFPEFVLNAGSAVLGGQEFNASTSNSVGSGMKLGCHALRHAWS